ncbi:wall-associated receptor kinase 2-like [Miscanthus floridulus]|uniref:wall-associated receptor kinase 2-like n=1 Tax=Miscanthus floridulus TaxID=154761 RepID=UPI0034575E92
MAQAVWFLLLAATVISHVVPVAATARAEKMVAAPSPLPTSPQPDCPDWCGDVIIPYPYGIGKQCSWRGKYSLTCNHNFNPPRPYLGSTEVVDISVESGEIRVRVPVSSLCYSSLNNKINTTVAYSVTHEFLISAARNEFTAIGCNTLAQLQGQNYYSGCITSCVSLAAAARDSDRCTGLGCCQTSILENLNRIAVIWASDSRGNTRGKAVWSFNPCSYAFVAEKVLEWAIRADGHCPAPTEKDGVMGEPTASACVNANSHCVNATQGFGYLCNCSKGYTGNPYVIGGCTNIDECTRPNDFPCHGVCKDTYGSYECNCPAGYESHGDPKETPCRPKLSSSAKRIIGITVGASILFFIILGTGVCYMLKRIEQKAKERELEAIERKNGSERLKNVKTLILFTKDELDKITMNNSVPLGKGGFGEVHKGTLSDKIEVAVKSSNEVTQGTLDKFVEEVEIQSRMMHRNILKLLGCCLRVDVPLLVYEYAAKGSLKDILHGKHNDQQREPLTLRSRLDIAIGSAQGLAYMHSYTENGIQHADVKPDNILLDGGLVPKISDFGLSKVSVVGKDYTMNVIGCLPYMDPVYKDTGRLTPKSDVYSFGIVLLELICRRPVVDGENNLVKQFKSAYEQVNTGRELFDRDIAEEQDIPILDEIGILAMKCLKENVNERPAMASVASTLVILKDSWEEKIQRFSSTSIN